MRKVALCMACYKGAEPEVVDGLIRMGYKIGRETQDEFAPFFAMRKRAELAANFALEQMEASENSADSRFTHVVWIDDDIVVNGHKILRLLDCVDDEHPVVAALAFERHRPHRPGIWASTKFGDLHTGVQQILDYPPDSLIRISAAGLCCVAFDREVFAAINKPYCDWKYKGFDRSSYTPDGYLFGQFRDHDIPCFCHTGIMVGHMMHPKAVGEEYAKRFEGHWDEERE